jgi:hypothetical protein
VVACGTAAGGEAAGGTTEGAAWSAARDCSRVGARAGAPSARVGWAPERFALEGNAGHTRWTHGTAEGLRQRTAGPPPTHAHADAGARAQARGGAAQALSATRHKLCVGGRSNVRRRGAPRKQNNIPERPRGVPRGAGERDLWPSEVGWGKERRERKGAEGEGNGKGRLAGRGRAGGGGPRGRSARVGHDNVHEGIGVRHPRGRSTAVGGEAEPWGWGAGQEHPRLESAQPARVHPAPHRELGVDGGGSGGQGQRCGQRAHVARQRRGGPSKRVGRGCVVHDVHTVEGCGCRGRKGERERGRRGEGTSSHQRARLQSADGEP